MNRLSTLMAATFLSAAMLVSPAAQAMQIEQFDKLAIPDQGDYIALLITGAHKILVEAGRNEDAAKMSQLFSEIRPGDQMSVGMLQLESNIDRARLVDAERYAKDHNVRRLEIEDAMLVTLKKNGIVLPPEFVHVADNFHPKLPLRTLTADARPIDPPSQHPQ